MNQETFSTYASVSVSRAERYTQERSATTARDAMFCAKSLTDSGKFGRVWVVCDQDDMTVFEWQEGRVLFPTQEDIERSRAS